jgi:hypothetical protein
MGESVAITIALPGFVKSEMTTEGPTVCASPIFVLYPDLLSVTLCHSLEGTNVLLSPVCRMFQLHMSTFSYILSTFQECDITEVT